MFAPLLVRQAPEKCWRNWQSVTHFPCAFLITDHSSQLNTKQSCAHQGWETIGVYVCSWVGWDQHHICPALWCLFGLSILWASGQPILLHTFIINCISWVLTIICISVLHMLAHMWWFECFSCILFWVQVRICVWHSFLCKEQSLLLPWVCFQDRFRVQEA